MTLPQWSRLFRRMTWLSMLCFLLPIVSSLSAQVAWWEVRSESLPTDGDRRLEPTEARFTKVDVTSLLNVLESAPHERTISAEQSTTILDVPQPDGGLHSFRIVAYDIAEEGLPVAFRDIKTWYGINVGNPGQTIFLDWTSRGFHASVRYGGAEGYFIDPVFRGDRSYYQIYRKHHLTGASLGGTSVHEGLPFACSVGEANQFNPSETVTSESSSSHLLRCDFKEYVVAIAATGEFSNYHGAMGPGQSDLVHSAIVTTINRVNQIYSHEIGLRLKLIANNDEVFYYNRMTDPYSGGSASGMLTENTENLNAVLGEESYDLGHVFSAGFNSGVAYLSVSCRDFRGAGVTGSVAPEGDPFAIDYVAHEIGHQIGANHTQNNACNYSAVAGVEPGSGSTIMGYAGICAPDVQESSDDYFHGMSLREIAGHLQAGAGASCATLLDTTLTRPTIMELEDETIPPNTPLLLSSSAEGGANLTYGWEQMDPEKAIFMPPSPKNKTGPMFRSLPPIGLPERYLPALPDVIQGVTPKWEVLPDISRELNFRLTARSNNAEYGCWSSEDIKLTVDDADGAFRVTDPNSGNQFSSGQSAQVLWETANTQEDPIGCSTVDILLSMDGGNTFTLIAEGENNDGFAIVDLPEEITTAGRIMVRCVENVFYAVSEIDFTIKQAEGPPLVGLEIKGESAFVDCFETLDELTFTFLTFSNGGEVSPLTFRAENLPAGVTASFYPSFVPPGGLVTLKLSGLDQMETGSYDIGVRGLSGNMSARETIRLRKITPEESVGPQLLFPQSGYQNVELRPTFRLEDMGAHTIEFQLSTTADFNNLVLQTASSLSTITLSEYLTGNTLYYWRSRSATGGCGFTQWRTGSFRTGDCSVYQSNSVARPFGEMGGPATTEMKIRVDKVGRLTDVDIYQLDVAHEYLGDVEVRLQAPDGTSELLINRQCTEANNIFISLDDDAKDAVFPCPPVNPGLFVPPPNGSLSAFNNLSAAGDWTLKVTDNVSFDGGQLRGFGLKVCVQSNLFLSVVWLDFTVQPRKSEVELRWITGEEIDNQGFHVERAEGANGIGDWVVLGRVEPSGKDSGEYVFRDRTAKEGVVYYYRIRQTDFDGTVDYSPVRSGQKDSASPDLLIYPNPVGNYLTYRHLVSPAEDRPFEICNADGRIVMNGLLESSGGRLSLEKLPSGVYLLRIPGDRLGRVYRVIKGR